MAEADPRADGNQRTTGDMGRVIDQKKSLPIYEIQKQYWTSLSSTNNSGPNFSGTPDYIPASLYSPSVSGVTRQPFQSYPVDRTSRLPNGGLNDLNVRRDANSNDHSRRMTGCESDRMNYISEDSGIYSFQAKPSTHDNGANRKQLDNGSLCRMISENHRGQRQHYDNNYATINRATTARAKSKTRVSEEIEHQKVSSYRNGHLPTILH